MGITITVGGVAGIPLLALSGPIISKIGHANVLFIGFVFYAIRLVGEYLSRGGKYVSYIEYVSKSVKSAHTFSEM